MQYFPHSLGDEKVLHTLCRQQGGSASLDRMTDGDRRKQIAFRTEETGKRDGWKSGTGAARHFMLLRFGAESGDTRMHSFHRVNMLLHWYVLQWEDDSNALNKKSTPQWISLHLWPLLVSSGEDGLQQTWPHTSSYKPHITEESTVFWKHTHTT